MNLTDITNYVPDAVLDLRYATPRNITGTILYATGFHAQLDEAAAQALARAAEEFRMQGLRLVVWDAYRPEDVQQKLRAVNSDDQYVLEESNHCKGVAVDLTLARSDNTYLDMGTDHDDFTPRAHADAADLSPEQAHNRQVLLEGMTTAGFTQWPYEWWHFDYSAA